jgi:hypothetical protein
MLDRTSGKIIKDKLYHLFVKSNKLAYKMIEKGRLKDVQGIVASYNKEEEGPKSFKDLKKNKKKKK